MMTTHAGESAPPAVGRRAWFGAGLAMAAVGWGANQFAPLIVMYEARLGLSAAVVDALFAFYALGLVPTLLAGGRLSDRIGRRAVVRSALLVSFLATCLLMTGGHQELLLYAGRLLAGTASGLAFGAGAAWIKELSADAGDSAAGPRRATIAMTAGFAGGPLVAGACAQWLPSPEVTAYLPHLAVLIAAAGPAWRTPDPSRMSIDSAGSATRIGNAGPQARLGRHFLLIMLPFAPWVFGTAAIALAYLPVLAAPRAGHRELLFSALATGLTALAGIAAQPLARTASRLPPGRLLPASMTLVLAGLGCAAWAAQTLSLPLVLLASAVLGVAYGITQFAGLAEVQRIADPRSLGMATAVYQVLSYIGFAFPFLLSLVGSHSPLSPSALLLVLLGVAATAAACLAITTARTARERYRSSASVDP
jgi:MFS family permease